MRRFPLIGLLFLAGIIALAACDSAPEPPEPPEDMGLIPCDTLVITGGATPPEPVLIGVPGNTTIDLSWSPNELTRRPDDESEPVRHEIFVAADTPVNFSCDASDLADTANPFEGGRSLTSLINDRLYYIYMRSRSEDNRVAFSDTIVVSPAALTVGDAFFIEHIDPRVQATWAPDDQGIYYMAPFDSTDEATGQQISVQSIYALDSTNQAISIKHRFAFAPTWSPAGDMLAFYTNKDEVGLATHIAVSDELGMVTKLTSGDSFNGWPAWSPDGMWLAFIVDDGGGSSEVWKVQVDGSGLQAVTNNTQTRGITNMMYGRPAWTADGTEIAVAMLDVDGGENYTRTHKRDIVLISADGGTPTPLIASPWDDYLPAFSPLGDQVAFLSNRSGAYNVWVFDRDANDVFQVTSTAVGYPFPLSGLESLDWSSDGRFILYNDGRYDSETTPVFIDWEDRK